MSCSLHLWLILCSTRVEFGTFLIWLAVSFYITWFIAVHVFTQNIIPLAPYGEVSFLKYLIVFCILWTLKNAEWRQRTISDTAIITVGNEKIFIKCDILVLNCVLTILNFYFKIVDTLAVKSAFHTCVQEPKVLSLSVFGALVVMYSKWCTIYCGGPHSPLIMEKK